MDIHRLRIVPYPASPINAVAFSHDPNPAHRAPRTLRLAVGRANGDVEIWNPSEGRWVQERILHSSQDHSIEGLVWTQDPTYEDEDREKQGGQLRLFSVGYSSVVTEWNISQGKPIRHASGGEGEIWCLAAQPRSGLPKPADAASVQEERYHQKLVVGCADGSLTLYSTAGDDLRYLRTLPRPPSSKARVLSVAWQSTDRIVAGYSDNSIRVYDIRGRGRNLHTMSIAPDAKRGVQDVLVWAVKCLPDGTIVSGDSSGEVKVWDAATLSLIQQLKSHNADILTLSLSLDGSTMLSGGIDRRTVTYRRIASGKNKGRWAVVSHRRMHASDVKTMGSYESKDVNVVVSGGLDATAIVLPRSGVGLEHHRRLAVHPNSPPLQSAPSKRLIMSYWGSEVRIWRVDKFASNEGDNHSRLSHRLVAKIELQGTESIASATLAKDGSLLAVSTGSSTRVFRLQETSGRALRVQKLKMPNILDKKGSTHIEFSPNVKWLLQVHSDSRSVLFRICYNESDEEYIVKPKPIKIKRAERLTASRKPRSGNHGDYTEFVQRIAWSDNSRILVFCDIKGQFDSWVLEGHEDLMQDDDNLAPKKGADGSTSEEDSSDEEEPVVVFGQRWVRLDSILPKLGTSPLILSFRPDWSPQNEEATVTVHPTRHNPHPHSHDVPQGEDRLVAVSAKHQVFEYHVMEGAFTDWSRRNPPETFPQDFQNIRERAMGCVWDVSAETTRLWLYGSSWLWMFNLSVDMERDYSLTNGIAKPGTALQRKRKRDITGADIQKLMQNTSGAGSRIPYAEQDSGMMPAVLETEDAATQWVSFDVSDANLDDGLVAPETNSDLTQLRRRGHVNGSLESKGDNDDVAMVSGNEDEENDDEGRSSTPVRHWGSFKYRPILGIVPLGTTVASDDQQASGNIEVALVERPLWDVDLPQRWEGDQEWNK